jgi:ribonucleoside-diphosphate reductase alpha chain
MRGFDAFAGVIKSGGKTRRAAKMNILNWHTRHQGVHPGQVQRGEEGLGPDRAGLRRQLQRRGLRLGGFQNENHSVRVTDEFMQAAIEDREWTTRWVTDPSKAGPTYKARDLLLRGWPRAPRLRRSRHPVRGHHPEVAHLQERRAINSSNPCSEYMFLDDTACNLAP